MDSCMLVHKRILPSMVVPREMTYNNDINTLDNTKPILEIMTCARSICATTTCHERILLDGLTHRFRR